MTDRERLIELIKEAKKHTKGANCDIERTMFFADYLLANGVIVPPCKVGDMVYKVSFVHKTVTPLKVEGFICSLGGYWKVHCTHLVPSWVGNQKEHFYYSFSSFGKTVFLNCKEAEKALSDLKKGE